MPTLLLEQLDHLRQRIESEAWKQDHDWATIAEETEEMTAMAIHLFRRIEAAGARKLPADRKQWSVLAAREFIPIFQQWFAYATPIREMRRVCKEHGFPVEGGQEFLHSYNVAKMMALDFDRLLEISARIDRGESIAKPLGEVMNELRDRL